MFENYSLADLFANIYKNKVVNLVLTVAIFLLMAVPLSLQALKAPVKTKEATSYSSYLIYKIDAPNTSGRLVDSTYGRYSDFYSKLISSNLNGAFIFNDVSDEEVATIASELSSNATQLRNSNLDFWDKKIQVNSLVDNGGVSVKLLTQSKTLNTIIEKKLDSLINQYKTTYADVTVTKLDTVYSQDGGVVETTSSFSVKQLMIKLAVVAVVAVFMVCAINMLAYLFNPTINRVGDYSKYKLDFVFEGKDTDTLVKVIDYKANQTAEVTIISSNKKVLEKFKKSILSSTKPIHFEVLEDGMFEELLQSNQIIFVEEFGVSRYAAFEKKLQDVRSLNKQVLGVVTYSL